MPFFNFSAMSVTSFRRSKSSSANFPAQIFRDRRVLTARISRLALFHEGARTFAGILRRKDLARDFVLNLEAFVERAPRTSQHRFLDLAHGQRAIGRNRRG